MSLQVFFVLLAFLFTLVPFAVCTRPCSPEASKLCDKFCTNSKEKECVNYRSGNPFCSVVPFHDDDEPCSEEDTSFCKSFQSMLGCEDEVINCICGRDLQCFVDSPPGQKYC